MTPRPDYIYDSHEKVDITTPYPNPWDSFRTACGSAIWCRIDRVGQIRHLNGGVCGCPRIVKYINPPWLPDNIRELLENKPPEIVLAQGRARPSGWMTFILTIFGIR